MRVLDGAVIKQSSRISGYSALVTVPLAELRPDPSAVSTTRGAVGVIFSDPAGNNCAARVYWFDKNTTLVSDVPSEAPTVPKHWGRIIEERDAMPEHIGSYDGTVVLAPEWTACPIPGYRLGSTC